MNEVKYTYQRTKEDFFKHSIWHRMLKSRLSVIMNFVFPVLAIVAFLMSFGMELESIHYLAMLYLVAMPFINYVFIKARVNKVFSNPEFQFDKTTFTFNDDGITTASERGEVTLEWEHIKTVYVVKNYIYVYIDRVNAFLINKEFVGEENTEKIIKLFVENTKAFTVKFRKY